MKARILVVDDEEKVCQSLEEILRLENYQVAAVTSGADALSVLRVDNFDLVLLDLKMPGVDGIDVLRSIRSNNPETRVILLTGHGSLETAIEALRLGANDYLLKPASSGEILNSVERALSACAEQIRKRQLLEQLGVSLQRLKDIEGLENTSAVNHAVLSLENGVVVDFIRREVYRGSTRVILTPTEVNYSRYWLKIVVMSCRTGIWSSRCRATMRPIGKLQKSFVHWSAGCAVSWQPFPAVRSGSPTCAAPDMYLIRRVRRKGNPTPSDL